MHNQMKALLVCLLSSFLLIAFLFKRKKMNAVRNGFPPRPNPPPVGSGSSASGLTKRQCRRRKEKRHRLRKASPYLVVVVASHYLLPWTSFALVDAVRKQRKPRTTTPPLVVAISTGTGGAGRENSGRGVPRGGRGALHGAATGALGLATALAGNPDVS
ncbi:hypothetical protein N7536_002891 [Penicillium majusculum]|nr:hypothetical protein N7536_002891 [Penicillium majusculum]